MLRLCEDRAGVALQGREAEGRVRSITRKTFLLAVPLTGAARPLSRWERDFFFEFPLPYPFIFFQFAIQRSDITNC
jgi:hypothetical protein